MRYEAVLFDMDGVIVDTTQSVTAFWLRLAARHGLALGEADFARHIYGCAATHTLDALFPRLTAQEREAVLAEMAEYEMHLRYTGVRGAVPFLRALRARGVPTALVTSGARWKVEAVTGQLHIGGLFAAFVTAEDIQHSKPHPEPYLLAAQKLGKPAAHCLVFEDSISGVQAAVAAGALCIGVRPVAMAAPLYQAGARFVVPDFSAARLLPASPGRPGADLRLDLGTDRPDTLLLVPGDR